MITHSRSTTSLPCSSRYIKNFSSAEGKSVCRKANPVPNMATGRLTARSLVSSEIAASGAVATRPRARPSASSTHHAIRNRLVIRSRLAGNPPLARSRLATVRHVASTDPARLTVRAASMVPAAKVPIVHVRRDVRALARSRPLAASLRSAASLRLGARSRSASRAGRSRSLPMGRSHSASRDRAQAPAASSTSRLMAATVPPSGVRPGRVSESSYDLRTPSAACHRH